mmetsp:Transcript_20391/g.29598  ORF Transcript_20391/g.29598 Transcript_20391/m.29598 type:complete len:171 (-) Transcript_20391:595-1107(-)
MVVWKRRFGSLLFFFWSWNCWQVMEGQQAPVVSGVDQYGKKIDLADVLGKKSLILFFYPKDFTSGCTKEVCSFRDSSEDFKALGAEIIGVSSDSEESHKSFAEQNNIRFSLLADGDGAIRKAYKVPKGLLGLAPGRVTYVINGEGKIVKILNSMFDISSHIAEAKKALEA